MGEVKQFHKCQVNVDGDLLAINEKGEGWRLVQSPSHKWHVMADVGVGGKWKTIFSDYSHLNATRYFAKQLAR